jgi:hypothetical protein
MMPPISHTDKPGFASLTLVHTYKSHQNQIKSQIWKQINFQLPTQQSSNDNMKLFMVNACYVRLNEGVVQLH